VLPQVNPQFYAFRWITLLLTQEFAFPDAMRLWDTLLGDARGRLDCLLRICVAMLLSVRQELLQVRPATPCSTEVQGMGGPCPHACLGKGLKGAPSLLVLVRHWNENPVYVCQIGSKVPIVSCWFPLRLILPVLGALGLSVSGISTDAFPG
jgi:Rab-GTPase-TBC domain